MILARQLEFPAAQPDGFPVLADEPPFEPAHHLALEAPREIRSLRDLGYGADICHASPTQLAVTSAFRLLSEEGVACLQQVAEELKPSIRSLERISRMVRGGAYQSRFLRDLCLSPDVADFISGLCEAPMAPHTIPHQLGHLNYNPEQTGENVDKWHVDTLRVDYVLFVTDPAGVQGGEFQYFDGTKEEVAALKVEGQALPANRVISPDVPGAGWAVLQQGNHVVHRARGLEAPGERVTMVNGYVPLDMAHPDFTRYDQLFLADPAHVSTTEYRRHVAWMARERLQHMISNAPFADDREAAARELEEVAGLLGEAAAGIRAAGSARMEHFGDE